MNLFDIDEKYFSHPKYSYQKHIKNIADSFCDKSHLSAALFHDLGKLCNDFQTYIDPSHPNRSKTTHSIVGALTYLANHNYHLERDSFSIFISILKHHGNLDDINEIAENLSDTDFLLHDYPDMSGKLNEIKKIIGCDEIDLEKCCDFFDADDSFVKEKGLNDLDMYFQTKEVFSKLVFADKFEAIFKQRYTEKQPLDAESFINKLETHLSKKTNDMSLVRNSARKDIIEKFLKNLEKSVFIVEAPTGIGKTYTALHLALEILKQKKKKRIITALPMTSIIDQTFLEYSKIFDEEVLLKYHHLTRSKPRMSDEQDEKNSEQEYFRQKESFLTKSWAEDSVIITTFNQILNLFYSNRNSDLIKFWTLRDSVIIMDEIQAVPRILLKDFSETISYLSKAFNIDFILMSATVPDIKQFLDAEITVDLLDNSYFSKDFNNRYSLGFDKTINSEEQLISAIEKHFKSDRSVLSLVNTKKLALKIFENLNTKHSQDELYLLSSNFIPIHRKEIIKEISNKLKKRTPIILVSTQVIEAGVDFDFDCGFREFAPFYSIIQTAGRINRENRKEIREISKLTVFPRLGFSPYHQNDLLEDKIEELLCKNIREKDLLNLLKEYFKTSIERTSPEMRLIPKMKNLNFKETAKIFDDNFMKNQPYLTKLFVEVEEGLYSQFYKKLEFLHDNLKEASTSLEKRIEIKVRIKEIYKKVAQYVINVPKREVDDFESFFGSSEMKVCPFDKIINCYGKTKGYFAPEKKHTMSL